MKVVTELPRQRQARRGTYAEGARGAGPQREAWGGDSRSVSCRPSAASMPTRLPPRDPLRPLRPLRTFLCVDWDSMDLLLLPRAAHHMDDASTSRAALRSSLRRLGPAARAGGREARSSTRCRTGSLAWGYMTDELYFLDSTDHLQWGYVDHPPLSIAVLALLRPLTGDGIFAIRVLPALLGAATIVLTGLIAREIGGGRTAQGLAALGGAGDAGRAGDVELLLDERVRRDPVGARRLAAAAHPQRRRTPWLWLVLGVVDGAGLLNKVSMLWFGAGVAVGLLLTPARRWLRTPWPWCAALIALADVRALRGVELAARLAVPRVQPQCRRPVQGRRACRCGVLRPADDGDGLRAARRSGSAASCIASVSRVDARYRARCCGCSSSPRRILALSRQRAAALSRAGLPDRLRGRWPCSPNAWRLRRRWLPCDRRRRSLDHRASSVAAPIATPVLSPELTVRYRDALGLRPPEERERGGALPMHLGLFFHAEALLGPLPRVFDSLTPEERARVRSSPAASARPAPSTCSAASAACRRRSAATTSTVSGVPATRRGDLMIVVHANEAELHDWFESCERRAEIDCPYCMEMMDAQAVYLCRHPRQPLRELWPSMRFYR